MKTRLLLQLIMTIALTAQLHAVSVRVESRNNMPTIVQDGVPQRPRWFFGRIRPGYGLVCTPTPRTVKETFKPFLPDNSRLTLHFRFEKKPSTVWVANISITDLTTGKVVLPKNSFLNGMDDFKKQWWYWPTEKDDCVAISIDKTGGPDNTPAIRIDFKERPEGQKWPDFHFYSRSELLSLDKTHEYQLEYWFRSSVESKANIALYKPGKPHYAEAARFQSSIDWQNGILADQIKLAKNAGIDYVTVPVHFPWARFDGDTAGFDRVRRSIQELIDVNPDIKLIPRLGVEPPYWWLQKNPAHAMQYDDGWKTHRFSVSSLKWRQEACKNLEQFIKYCARHFPDNVVGFHPSSQNTGEWFYYNSWYQKFHGYAPVEQEAFKNWLKLKYKSDDALAKAWNMPDMTLKNAQCPPPQRRKDATALSGFIDPTQFQDVIDHNQFLQDEMADTICALAKTVRKASDGKKLSVFFYGYAYEFSSMPRPSASGHYAMKRVLESPDIDILCSPISYEDRQFGGSSAVMSACESVALHGKLWLQEDDTSTHLSSEPFPGHKERTTTLEDTQKVLLRNLGAQACRNQASWWMDLGASGWFNDPGLWDEMKRFAPVDHAFLNSPTPFIPDIALVVDETSIPYANNTNRFFFQLAKKGRGQCARSGATFGQYLLDDVLAGKVNAKAFIFTNAWALDDAKRKQLKQLAQNNVVLWCHASGIIKPGQKIDLENTAELTGFKVELVPEKQCGAITATKLGTQLGLPPKITLNSPLPKHLFRITNAKQDEILATWQDGTPAIAMRGKTLFSSMPCLTPELVRVIAQKANATIWSTDNHNLYHKDNVFIVHAAHDGPVTIHFKKQRAGRELVTNKSFNGNLWKDNLKLGDTRVIVLDEK